MFKKKSKTPFKAFTLLPLAKSLFGYLEVAVEEGIIYSEDNTICLDAEAMRDHISDKVLEAMTKWKPLLNGVEVLDEETRLAGAKFLAGIASLYISKKAAA